MLKIAKIDICCTDQDLKFETNFRNDSTMFGCKNCRTIVEINGTRFSPDDDAQDLEVKFNLEIKNKRTISLKKIDYVLDVLAESKTNELALP